MKLYPIFDLILVLKKRFIIFRICKSVNNRTIKWYNVLLFRIFVNISVNKNKNNIYIYFASYHDGNTVIKDNKLVWWERNCWSGNWSIWKRLLCIHCVLGQPHVYISSRGLLLWNVFHWKKLNQCTKTKNTNDKKTIPLSGVKTCIRV